MNETFVLHITKLCNLNCFYCYEKDKSSTYSLNDLKHTVDSFFQTSGGNVVHVEFLGGEPLLEFTKLHSVHRYMEVKYGDRIESFTITSNGTILSDDIINFLRVNPKVHLAISMDGTEFANQLRVDKDGVNSYNRVVENIDLLRKANLDITVHIVTHPYNVAYLCDSVHYLHDLGVKSFGIGTVESTLKIDFDYCDTFKKQIDKLIPYVIEKSINVDLFEYLKPTTDVRTYIYDKVTGALVFETYGRIKDQFLDESKYRIKRCTEHDSITEMIHDIRRYAYEAFQKESSKMSLLNKAEHQNPSLITDCVGKVGVCPFVTNPLNQALYKDLNITSKDDFRKIIENTFVNTPFPGATITQPESYIDRLKEGPSTHSPDPQTPPSVADKLHIVTPVSEEEFREIIGAALKETILLLQTIAFHVVKLSNEHSK